MDAAPQSPSEQAPPRRWARGHHGSYIDITMTPAGLRKVEQELARRRAEMESEEQS